MVIQYNKLWNDYTQNGGLIIDLEKFIATALELGETITFEIVED